MDSLITSNQDDEAASGIDHNYTAADMPSHEKNSKPLVKANPRRVVLISIVVVSAVLILFFRKETWIWTTLGYMWEAFLFYNMAGNIRSGESQQTWRFFKLLRPVMFLQALLELSAVVVVGFTLYALPVLNWTWLKLIPLDGGHSTNLMVMPLARPLQEAAIKHPSMLQSIEMFSNWILAFGFLGILVLNLPAFAHAEELDFRDGTKNWKDGFKRSIRFGLVHCFVGIPIAFGLSLSIGGMWFTHQYFKGGVDNSTAHHLAHNLLVMTFILVILVSTLLHFHIPYLT